jgi:single-strand DNA-binding protein
MLNKVILMGRLTRDPEMRTTPSGASVCRFSVAVDRPFVSKESGQREADFINVIAWRATADFIGRYFSKGKMIIVEGSLRNNNYTDSNGVKHYSYEVQADNVSFGESKSASQGGNGGFNGGGQGYSAQGSGYNGGSNGGSNGSYNGGGFNTNTPGGYGQSGTQGGGFNGGQGSSNQGGSSQGGFNGGGFGTSSDDLGLGDLGDFEEIISDGEVPF